MVNTTTIRMINKLEIADTTALLPPFCILSVNSILAG